MIICFHKGELVKLIKSLINKKTFAVDQIISGYKVLLLPPNLCQFHANLKQYGVKLKGIIVKLKIP